MHAGTMAVSDRAAGRRRAAGARVGFGWWPREAACGALRRCGAKECAERAAVPRCGNPGGASWEGAQQTPSLACLGCPAVALSHSMREPFRALMKFLSVTAASCLMP